MVKSKVPYSMLVFRLEYWGMGFIHFMAFLAIRGAMGGGGGGGEITHIMNKVETFLLVYL